MLYTIKSQNLALIILIVTATLAVLAVLLLLKPEADTVWAQEEGDSGTNEIVDYQQYIKNHNLSDIIVMPGDALLVGEAQEGVVDLEQKEVTAVDLPYPLERKKSPLEVVGRVEGTVLGSSLEVGEEISKRRPAVIK